MTKWMMVAVLLASSVPALAQEATPMLAPEREAYLEACLVVTQSDPILATYQRMGTGTVTRGHATVALFDLAQGRSAQLDCNFATLTNGPAPTAEKLAVTYADKSVTALDLATANASIAEQMQ